VPIRPEMRHLYPPPKVWRALRERILERAGNRCECRGECGARHDGLICWAPNGAMVWRYVYDDPGAGWLESWRPGGEGSPTGELEGLDPSSVRFVRIVLTISHRDHDPTNNDPENLRALCQRCHLRYDAAHHARTRAETKARP
jgi:hypothetical protein